jgi:hypothetical protein
MWPTAAVCIQQKAVLMVADMRDQHATTNIKEYIHRNCRFIIQVHEPSHVRRFSEEVLDELLSPTLDGCFHIMFRSVDLDQHLEEYREDVLLLINRMSTHNTYDPEHLWTPVYHTFPVQFIFGHQLVLTVPHRKSVTKPDGFTFTSKNGERGTVYAEPPFVDMFDSVLWTREPYQHNETYDPFSASQSCVPSQKKRKLL